MNSRNLDKHKFRLNFLDLFHQVTIDFNDLGDTMVLIYTQNIVALRIGVNESRCLDLDEVPLFELHPYLYLMGNNFLGQHHCLFSRCKHLSKNSS